MLILSRRRGESIMLGDDIEIAVVRIKGDQVQIGIRAPRTLVVDRKEVADRKAIEAEISQLLHVDQVVELPAGEVRTLRPGIDYDPDAVCPGCRCFRDKCVCDLRETAGDCDLAVGGTIRDGKHYLVGEQTGEQTIPTPAVKGNMSGRGRLNVAKVFEKLRAAEIPVGDLKKN